MIYKKNIIYSENMSLNDIYQSITKNVIDILLIVEKNLHFSEMGEIVPARRYFKAYMYNGLYIFFH